MNLLFPRATFTDFVSKSNYYRFLFPRPTFTDFCFQGQSLQIFVSKANHYRFLFPRPTITDFCFQGQPLQTIVSKANLYRFYHLIVMMYNVRKKLSCITQSKTEVSLHIHSLIGPLVYTKFHKPKQEWVSG